MGFGGGEYVSDCDWKVSKARRRMADRRFWYKLEGLAYRFVGGMAIMAVAIVSLG